MLVQDTWSDLRQNWRWAAAFLALLVGAWAYSQHSRAEATRNAGLEDYREYRCTTDCGAYRAGGTWAVAREIQNGRQCPRRSEAFYQGCLEEVATWIADTAPEPPEG